MKSDKVTGKKIALFGGTTEGRKLALFLANEGYTIDLYVATDYAKEFVAVHPLIHIIEGRCDAEQLSMLFKLENYIKVIDTTHPYAQVISTNIREAIDSQKIIRIVREAEIYKNCIYVEDIEGCICYLEATSGKVLLTTGSKDLEVFAKLTQYQERLYPRVLPVISSLERCITLGYTQKHIICMQGPFTKDLNRSMLEAIDAKYMVTKDSAKSGGLEEKVNAAREAGVTCIIIKRPEDRGITLEAFQRDYMTYIG